jgi:YHS domain-containing protein
MKFLYLTSLVTDKKMLLNLNKITCVYWDDKKSAVKIELEGGEYFFVKESVEEIVKTLKYEPTPVPSPSR